MKKKLGMSTLVCGVSLFAQTYTSTGVATAESKKGACTQAMQYAKANALEEAGTMVSTSFHAKTSDSNGKIDKETKYKLDTTALGIAKLKSKHEDVKVSENYQFTCSVSATFSIDQAEMKEAFKKILENQNKEQKISGYFEAEGYSEEGQSRYKAFTAATLVAQRNLVEKIQKAKITSITKLNNGRLDDRMAKLIKGSISGAETVSKEYDSKERYAKVVLRVSKQSVYDSLNK